MVLSVERDLLHDPYDDPPCGGGHFTFMIPTMILPVEGATSR